MLHRLATSGGRLCATGMKKDNQVFCFTLREHVLEGWHAVTSLEYLSLDLMRPTALANSTQVGRAIAADARDAVAALAALRLERGRAAGTRIGVRCMSNRTVYDSKDSN
jgi:hypothetical protein